MDIGTEIRIIDVEEANSLPMQIEELPTVEPTSDPGRT